MIQTVAVLLLPKSPLMWCTLLSLEPGRWRQEHQVKFFLAELSEFVATVVWLYETLSHRGLGWSSEERGNVVRHAGSNL